MDSDRNRFHRILWDGHAVVGAFIGVALFIMFYCGAFALYRGELHAWVDPHLRAPSGRTHPQALNTLLSRFPPNPGSDVHFIFPIADRPYIFARYLSGDKPLRHRVGRESGAILPSHGRVAVPDIIHRLHYFRQLGLVGRTMAGLIAVASLFVVISGLILHWNHIQTTFHRFRIGRGWRLAITDLHTSLGTITLPFTVLYTVTGGFLGLSVLLLSLVVLVVFDGDQGQLDALLVGLAEPETRTTGVSTKTIGYKDVEPLIQEIWGDDAHPTRMVIKGWKDEGAVVMVDGGPRHTLTESGRAMFDGTNGSLLMESRPEEANPLTRTANALSNLHFARLGTGWYDPMYFLLSLASSAVILSGIVLWLFGRVNSELLAPRFMDWLLARSTVGVCAGLVAVIPISLGFAKLLPLVWTFSVALENAVFFGIWGGFFIGAFVVSKPLRFGEHVLRLGAVSSGVAVVIDVTLTIVGLVVPDVPSVTVNIGLIISGFAIWWISSRIFSGFERIV